jgi:hypothetical protein
MDRLLVASTGRDRKARAVDGKERKLELRLRDHAVTGPLLKSRKQKAEVGVSLSRNRRPSLLPSAFCLLLFTT